MSTFHYHAGKVSTEIPVDALMSGDPISRAFARGAASGFGDKFMQWINAEFDRPKADPTVVVHAAMLLQLQFLACVFAETGKDEASVRHLTEFFVDLAGRVIPAHVAQMRQYEAEMRKERRP